MDLKFDKEAYSRYVNKKNTISNKRIRPESESFMDALLSADMTATPEGREILEAIKDLK